MSSEPPMVTGLVPCATVLVSVASGARRDATTATAVFVAEKPPLLSVSLADHILTRELVEESGQFVVNIASSEQTDLAGRLGSTHGGEVDKFTAFDVPTEPAEVVASPRIAGSYANLECTVTASHPAGRYTVYLCDVVAYAVDESKRPLVWHRGQYVSL